MELLLKLVAINLKPLPFMSKGIFFIGVSIIVFLIDKFVYAKSIFTSEVYSFDKFINSQKSTEADKKPKKVLGMLKVFFNIYEYYAIYIKNKKES